MSNVKCQMSNVKCQMSNVKCQMSNVKCQMSNCMYASMYVRTGVDSLNVRCTFKDKWCTRDNWLLLQCEPQLSHVWGRVPAEQICVLERKSAVCDRALNSSVRSTSHLHSTLRCAGETSNERTKTDQQEALKRNHQQLEVLSPWELKTTQGDTVDLTV